MASGATGTCGRWRSSRRSHISCAPSGTAIGCRRNVSGSYPDTLHDVGLVLGVYVVIVLLATVRRPGPARVIAVAFEPLRAIGAVALSLYLLHVGIIAMWARAGYTGADNDLVSWLIIVPGMVLAAWLWWRFIGVGPVEYLLGWVTGRPKALGRAKAA